MPFKLISAATYKQFEKELNEWEKGETKTGRESNGPGHEGIVVRKPNVSSISLSETDTYITALIHFH